MLDRSGPWNYSTLLLSLREQKIQWKLLSVALGDLHCVENLLPSRWACLERAELIIHLTQMLCPLYLNAAVPVLTAVLNDDACYSVRRPSRFLLADGMSNGLNLICQFTAANLFTHIICLVSETFNTHIFSRQVNRSFSDARQGHSPCGYRFLNHRFTDCSFFFLSSSTPLPFPTQKKRSEWSQVQTEREPATPSRTARPAWAAWREEVSHVTHVFLSLSLSLTLYVTAVVA